MKVSQVLNFTITEIDVETQDELGEYDEDFTTIETCVLGTKDYLKSAALPDGKFKQAWETIAAQGKRDGNLAEQAQTFQLPFKSMN